MPQPKAAIAMPKPAAVTHAIKNFNASASIPALPPFLMMVRASSSIPWIGCGNLPLSGSRPG
jgi:hypothetical protein